MFMSTFTEIPGRGVRFVRDNPQIIYTLFLLLAIPLAFFYTSENFLKIARDNQDSLERSRAGLLLDVFVEFTSEHLGDQEYLHARMRSIASQNETITRFNVLKKEGADLVVIASLDENEEGAIFNFFPETETSRPLFDLAQVPGKPAYTNNYYSNGMRIMRTVRGVPASASAPIDTFVIVDYSMAQGDQKASNNIERAYVTLFFVILLIIVLLARQARIIDYATLYQKLKEVDLMKDDFVAMAAHELRSPLMVIRAYTEMVGETETLSPASREHLKYIDNSAVQLNMLISDILDVSKLQEGRMSFAYADVDVSKEILDVVSAFLRPAQDKGLVLTYEQSPLPPISVDIGRFHQVMVNFIGNAIKYTPSGSVHVLTSATDDTLSIRISDTGMGISAEDQKKLFQKFFRARGAETSTITGTGLGLWITQEIVKTMRGTISVESIKGKGTDFIVSFPIVKK